MSYNLLRPVTIFSSTSMGATATSSVVEVKNQDNVGIQISWTTANAVGTFSVQISSDHMQDAEGNVTVAGNWVTLALSPAITAASANDTAYIEINQTSAQYIRLVYTRSSGTGTMTAILVAKGV